MRAAINVIAVSLKKKKGKQELDQKKKKMVNWPNWRQWENLTTKSENTNQNVFPV